MTTFVLVHGGAQGSWCWALVVPELARLGHRAVTPDLPIEDDNATLQDWASTILDSIPDDAGDDVVVVGHSMAGWVLPVVASLRSIRRMVFLGAVVPVIGFTPLEQHLREKEMILIAGVSDSLQNPETRSADATLSWEDARYSFYQDVDEPLARQAWRRMRRQSLAVLNQPIPLASWPDVPSTYIVMTDDHSVNPVWSRRYATEVLGADLIELPGSHSPFFSRPRELAEVLSGL